MATTITTTDQTIGSSYIYSSAAGFGFSMYLHAYVSKISSSGITVTVYYDVQPGGNFSGTWGYSGGCYSYDWSNGEQNRGTLSWDGTSNAKTVYSYTFTLPMSGGTYSGTLQAWTVYGWAGATKSNTLISVPVQIAIPPQGLTVANIVRGTNSFTGDVSVTNFGVGGTTSSYYKELQAWTKGFVAPRRWQIARNTDLTTTITVDNSSYVTSGSNFTLEPNTMYTLGVYVTNGSIATGSQNVGDYTTLPPAPTGFSIDSQTYETYDTVTAIMNYSVPADGGQYPKKLWYSLDQTTWYYFDVEVSSGSATTGQATIILPTDLTNQPIYLQSRTSAGNSPIYATTVSTLVEHESPTIGSWTFTDTNSDTVAITGDDTVFIQGVSSPKMVVDASDITVYDGTTIASVTGTFDNLSYTLDLASGVYSARVLADTAGTFAGVLTVVDSLGLETTSALTRTVISYSAPTVSASYTRTTEEGASSVSLAGVYSSITVNGVAKNTLEATYRLSDFDGLVRDWTSITLEISGSNYSGIIENLPTTYAGTYLVEIQVEDSLQTVTSSVTISTLDDSRVLRAPQYDVEVWTRAGEFIADITRFIQGDLSIKWCLDDIEDLSFTVSLDALELLKDRGASVAELLTPYAHDVRVRRNGKYIVGCQVVESTIQVGNDAIPKVKVKCTGYLNIFKDQYISEPMAGYSYPEMAHKLINRAQHADCLIRNPTGDIDASYWISPVASVAQTTVAYAGAGALQCIRTSSGWTGMGTQMRVDAGTPIKIDVWIAGAAGTVYIRERELINKDDTQGTMLTGTLTATGTYTHFTGTYTTLYDDGYIYIEQNQYGTAIRVDNCFVSRQDDEDALNNHYVGCIYSGLDDTTGGTGHNYADTGYVSTREYNYELQNVKDAIMDLVNMGEDEFDFAFTPDKIFNTYEQKGDYKPELELLYPGNIYSMNVDRSASNLANKIQEIGSGIGDERLEVWATDRTSRLLYGTRESVITDNNVSLVETLNGLAQGELKERNQVTRNLTVVVSDGSINPANLETGDILPFKIGYYLGVLSSSTDILENLEGWYRVTQISANITEDGQENMSLTLEFWSSFDES